MGQLNRGAVLVIALAIFVVFLPALIVPYGNTDDYMNLAHAEHLGLSSPPFAKSVMRAAVAEGRPLFGLIVDPVFSAAGTVDNLRFVRIIGVLGIVALGLLLYRALERSKVGSLPAALIALLVCAVPPFQLYAAWATTFAFPWAAFLAGCASLLVVAAVDAPRRLKLERSIGATVLLILPLFIYQPAAMFFWVFLAVALAGTVADPERAWRLARAHFAVAAVALVIGYLGYRLCVWLVGADATGAGRGAFIDDVVGRAEWFVHFGLYGSLNLFDLTWSPWFAVVVAAVAAGGILLWLLSRARRPLLFIALALILIPLADLPMLVVEETFDWQIVRTQVSLSAVIALYFGLGALAIWVTFREWLDGRMSRRALLAGERVAAALAIAFVATGAVVASRNVDTLIAEPQLRELRLLRGQVATLPDPVQKVTVVLSGPDELQPDTQRYDAFGVPSTVHWHFAVPLVLLLLREQGRLGRPPPVVDALPWYTSSMPTGAPVVNLNGLLRPPAER
jgi:hypothetical protein